MEKCPNVNNSFLVYFVVCTRYIFKEKNKQETDLARRQNWENRIETWKNGIETEKKIMVSEDNIGTFTTILFKRFENQLMII